MCFRLLPWLWFVWSLSRKPDSIVRGYDDSSLRMNIFRSCGQYWYWPLINLPPRYRYQSAISGRIYLRSIPFPTEDWKSLQKEACFGRIRGFWWQRQTENHRSLSICMTGDAIISPDYLQPPSPHQSRLNFGNCTRDGSFHVTDVISIGQWQWGCCIYRVEIIHRYGVWSTSKSGTSQVASSSGSLNITGVRGGHGGGLRQFTRVHCCSTRHVRCWQAKIRGKPERCVVHTLPE